MKPMEFVGSSLKDLLHAFQKKARKTPQRDLVLARARFRQIRGARS